MTSLHNSVRPPTTLNSLIPCITFQFIHSLLYLALKQISHLSLYHAAIMFGQSHIHLTSSGKMSGPRERDLTRFFCFKNEERLQLSLHFLLFKACPISCKLCYRDYIFQVWKFALNVAVDKKSSFTFCTQFGAQNAGNDHFDRSFQISKFPGGACPRPP